MSTVRLVVASSSHVSSSSSEAEECERLLPDDELSAVSNGLQRSPSAARYGNSACGSGRLRWLLLLAAIALTLSALLLFALAGSRRLHRSSFYWLARGDASHPSLLYSGRSVADWRWKISAASSSASSPFPPLASLQLPGLTSFHRCINASSGPPRVAVVSTRSSHPTAAMLSIASLQSGWCVVVLSELSGAARSQWLSETSRAAAEQTYDRVLSSLSVGNSSLSSSLSSLAFSRLCYIDRLEQLSLPYSLSSLVSSAAADVRHLGYLLAMQAGASAILDLHEHSVYLPTTALTADGDLPYERQAAHFLSAQPFAARIAQQQQQQQQGEHRAASRQLSATGARDDNVSVLNPYPLYGQVNSWPRGLPLNWVGATLPAAALSMDGVCWGNASQPSAASRTLCRPVVQHLLAGHYADLDGVYVATSSPSRRPPFDFLAPIGLYTQRHISHQTPAVAVPSGTYLPVNARSTLFLPDVFAALALPSGRHADIVRAFVLQTILTYNSQPQQHCVLVTPPHFAHVDCGSASTSHHQTEPTARMESVLSWLTQRQKGGSRQREPQVAAPGRSVSELLQWLYDGLYEAGVLDETDVAFVHAWLSDVSRVAFVQREQSTTAADSTPLAPTTADAALAARPPNASSLSSCFPLHSLPSAGLSSSSAPLNLPAQPAAILASDGKLYSLSQYADGFLFPDKYAADVPIDERPLHNADPSSVRPAGRWLPYPPHRHPPKPRVDFILRAFSGYSPLTSALMRSIDSFVPWRQLGELIVVLDDSAADRQYAASLPDDVRVHFEPKPAFFAEWGTAEQQTGALGVARQANGYALGLYSNWVSDRYSEADYICVLDPDMLFVTRATLPLMFDWDERQQLYKPVWICRDGPEDIFLDSSYQLFGLDSATAPGCMFQLPVCIHRSTLKRVRLRLNEHFNRSNSADYSKYGLEPAADRDSEYEQYGRQYDARRAEAGSLLSARESGVPPSAFERTYMRMVNRVLAHAVCQFCVWGSHIITQPAELSLYSLHLQGKRKDSSECPQIRAATHSGYLVPQPKMSPAYYQLADQLLMEGACRSAPPTDCIVAVCGRRAQWYDAMQARSVGLVPAEVLRQEVLFKWELAGMFLDAEHDKRCRPYAMAAVQQLYEWIQHFDLAPRHRRDRHCPHIALTG